MASARARRDGPENGANKSVTRVGLGRTARKVATVIWRTRWPVTRRPGSASARPIGAVSAARAAARWDCTGRAVPRCARVTTIRPAIQSPASASARGVGPVRIVTSPVRMGSSGMAVRNAARGRCTAIPPVTTLPGSTAVDLGISEPLVSILVLRTRTDRSVA